ncbi:MAG: benzoyl-CoA-dihydrodiol lyase, partial [Betaproteobacteria bacterium]|nr:benzoyl-CoA-dihydrodiol lyase [Betaproteobacteria bacterium]
VAKPQQFKEAVAARAAALAGKSGRPGAGNGVALPALERAIDGAGYHYRHVDVALDRGARAATITVSAPESALPLEMEGILAAGAAWWPLAMARELDDAILMLRANELEIGTWLLKTRGDIERVLACDAALQANAAHWFVRAAIGWLRRTLARLDVSSRTLFAIIDQNSCFAGTLFELALAADRSFMLELGEEANAAPRIALSEANFGAYPMANGLTRIRNRFCGEAQPPEAARARAGEKLGASAARELGLVTFTPDELDWDEELRIALEERASLSPDALTGLEANLRFAGNETMETRIFARLSAWQNWIFNRPNAVGEQGALKVYGTGGKAKFNWERV